MWLCSDGREPEAPRKEKRSKRIASSSLVPPPLSPLSSFPPSSTTHLEHLRMPAQLRKEEGRRPFLHPGDKERRRTDSGALDVLRIGTSPFRCLLHPSLQPQFGTGLCRSPTVQRNHVGSRAGVQGVRMGGRDGERVIPPKHGGRRGDDTHADVRAHPQGVRADLKMDRRG